MLSIRLFCVTMFLTISMLLIGSVESFAGELLYNGIQLPDVWPPKPEAFQRDKPQTPPYLVSPPSVISIDVGRQLFVDDFLIAETNLKRQFHQPVWHAATPVLQAETLYEKHGTRDIPFAAPFSDGVWYDPRDQTFKMWYQGGSGVYFCYATSKDGIHWDRPNLNQLYPDSNVLKIEPIQRDSSTVWLDLDDPNPERRFKMVYFRSKLFTLFSADGIRWSEPVAVHETGDRTTMFYNPFRKVWVYSIRGSRRGVGRCRYYAETTDLAKQAFTDYPELSQWMCADSLDRVRNVKYVDDRPDLYNLDATPYESLMLGEFVIHSKISEGNRPKLNHVTLGFSRDGFHWHRPDRRPFLDVSDDPAAWNYGNVQPAGAGCLVVGDKLYFYCSGRNSHKPQDDGSGGSTGLAVLRRDGFASVAADQTPGTLTTRPVRFSGQQLFVNVASAKGKLQVEILDEAGQPIAPFTQQNCLPVTTDATLVPVTWKGAKDPSGLAGKPVRFRFHLQGGELYSFWVSPDAAGASGGYVAGGGPGYTGHRDTVGRAALTAASKIAKSPSSR